MGEGATFLRYPVSEGDWYAEVTILKKGATPPLLGWAVIEDTDEGTKIARMGVVNGEATKKKDVHPKTVRKQMKKDADEKLAREQEEQAEKAGKEAEEAAVRVRAKELEDRVKKFTKMSI